MKKGNNKVGDKDQVKTVELTNNPALNNDQVWDVDYALQQIKDPQVDVPQFTFTKNKKPIVVNELKVTDDSPKKKKVATSRS